MDHQELHQIADRAPEEPAGHRTGWHGRSGLGFPRAAGLSGPSVVLRPCPLAQPGPPRPGAQGEPPPPTAPPPLLTAESLLVLALRSGSFWVPASAKPATPCLPFLRGGSDIPRLSFPRGSARPSFTPQSCCPQTFPRGDRGRAALDQPGSPPGAATLAATWSPGSWPSAWGSRLSPYAQGQGAQPPGGCLGDAARGQVLGDSSFSCV